MRLGDLVELGLIASLLGCTMCDKAPKSNSYSILQAMPELSELVVTPSISNPLNKELIPGFGKENLELYYAKEIEKYIQKKGIFISGWDIPNILTLMSIDQYGLFGTYFKTNPKKLDIQKLMKRGNDLSKILAESADPLLLLQDSTVRKEVKKVYTKNFKKEEEVMIQHYIDALIHNEKLLKFNFPGTLDSLNPVAGYMLQKKGKKGYLACRLLQDKKADYLSADAAYKKSEKWNVPDKLLEEGVFDWAIELYYNYIDRYREIREKTNFEKRVSFIYEVDSTKSWRKYTAKKASKKMFLPNYILKESVK